MSARTGIETVARPGPQDSIFIPSCFDAASPLQSAWTARSAVCCGSLTLMPGKARHTLRRERRNAFLVVSGHAQLALEIALAVELLGERRRGCRPHRLARAHQRPRRRGREGGGESVDLGREIRVVHAAPDQPPGCGLLGRKLLAEERETHGARAAGEARQE